MKFLTHMHVFFGRSMRPTAKVIPFVHDPTSGAGSKPRSQRPAQHDNDNIFAKISAQRRPGLQGL